MIYEPIEREKATVGRDFTAAMRRRPASIDPAKQKDY